MAIHKVFKRSVGGKDYTVDVEVDEGLAMAKRIICLRQAGQIVYMVPPDLATKNEAGKKINEVLEQILKAREIIEGATK